MKLRLRDDRCVGHGRCYELAPELFAEDDRGHCVLRVETVPPELTAAARTGEANCPERAIEIDD